MDTCKVVRIVSEGHAAYGGFKEINESDLSPDDVIWEPEAEGGDPVADTFSSMTNKDLGMFLELNKVEFDPKANKKALLELCRAVSEE